MAVTIGIPGGQRIESDLPSLMIGTDPSCNICLAGHAHIRPQHARLRVVNGNWQIEALDSGSLQVQGRDWSSSHQLKPGDVIRLSRTGPEIVFQPVPEAPSALKLPALPTGPIEELETFRQPNVVAAPSRVGLPSADTAPKVRPLPPSAPASRPVQRRPGDAAEHRRSSSLVWIGGASVVALLAVGVIFFAPPRRNTVNPRPLDRKVARTVPRQTEPIETESEPSPRPLVPTPVDVESEPVEPAPVTTEPSPEVAAPGPAGGSPNSKLPAPRVPGATPAQIDGSLYAIVLHSEDRSRTWRIGTACAVSDRQLATTAAIALAALELREDARVGVSVVPLLGDGSLPVIHLLPHPTYIDVVTQWGKMQSELADIAQALGETSAADATALKERQERFRQHADDYARQQLWYDVGLLTVADDLPQHLNVGYEPTLPDTAVTLLGLPFPLDQTADAPPRERKELSGKTAIWDNSSPVSSGWAVSVPASDDLGSWAGSPIVNESGILLGVHSRALDGVTHLVTDAGRLRELLARRSPVEVPESGNTPP